MAFGAIDAEPDQTDRQQIEIVLVTASRCHLCDDARTLLTELGGRYPLSIRVVELESDEGMAIAARLRVPFPPMLLLNGTYFGHGRISRGKLTKALDGVVGVEGAR